MSEPAKKTTKKTKRETTSRDDLVDELRNLSEVIDHLDIAVLFPEPDAELAGDCPFVDTACEAITQGGQVDAACLASLVYYIADMIEK